MESSAYINGELINLYTKENPMLEAGDICYAMIFSIDNFHRPIIVKAIVVEDTFVGGMNKQYDIRIIEILESPKTISEFVIGQQFVMIHKGAITKRFIPITKDFDFNEYTIKVEAFYVRNSESKIIELRNEYIKIVQKDLEKMLSEVKEINS